LAYAMRMDTRLSGLWMDCANTREREREEERKKERKKERKGQGHTVE
jgi:hypothetical protein